MLYASIVFLVTAVIAEFAGWHVIGWPAAILFSLTFLWALLKPNQSEIQRDRKWRESMVRRGMEDE